MFMLQLRDIPVLGDLLQLTVTLKSCTVSLSSTRKDSLVIPPVPVAVLGTTTRSSQMLTLPLMFTLNDLKHVRKQVE